MHTPALLPLRFRHIAVGWRPLAAIHRLSSTSPSSETACWLAIACLCHVITLMPLPLLKPLATVSPAPLAATLLPRYTLLMLPPLFHTTATVYHCFTLPAGCRRHTTPLLMSVADYVTTKILHTPLPPAGHATYYYAITLADADTPPLLNTGCRYHTIVITGQYTIHWPMATAWVTTATTHTPRADYHAWLLACHCSHAGYYARHASWPITPPPRLCRFRYAIRSVITPRLPTMNIITPCRWIRHIAAAIGCRRPQYYDILPTFNATLVTFYWLTVIGISHSSSSPPSRVIITVIAATGTLNNGHLASNRVNTSLGSMGFCHCRAWRCHHTTHHHHLSRLAY